MAGGPSDVGHSGHQLFFLDLLQILLTVSLRPLTRSKNLLLGGMSNDALASLNTKLRDCFTELYGL